MDATDSNRHGPGGPPRCPDCGEACSYVRLRVEIPGPGSLLVAEELPSLACQACGHTRPADHVRRQLEAVLALLGDEPMRARKDFSGLPLHPDDPGT